MCVCPLNLYLKAWLLACGISSQKVKNHGHRIGVLHGVATSEKLPAVPRLDDLVSALRAGHEGFYLSLHRRGGYVKDVN